MIDTKRRIELDAAIELTHFAWRELIARPDRVLEPRGLGRAHHRILYFVGKLRSPSVSEVLRALGVTKQALAGPLRDLYAQQLIAYERGVADARVKRLTLTPAGRKLEGRLAALQRQAFAAAFEAAGADAEAGWRRAMAHLAEGQMQRAGRLPPGASGPGTGGS